MQYFYYSEGQFKVARNPVTGTKCRTGQLNHQFVEQKFVGGVWVGIGDNDGVRYGDVAGAGCRFREGMRDGDYVVDVETEVAGFLLAEGDGWVNCGGAVGNYTQLEIEAVKPTNLTAVWVNDYAAISFTDNSGGLVQHEIVEAIGGGAYSVVTTLAAGVVTYNNYTWQNASMNFKIRAKRGNFSTYTDVVNLVTPLVWKTNQSVLTQVILRSLIVLAGKTVTVNWDDGVTENLTGTVTNKTHDYGVGNEGQYYISLSGDLNSITSINLRGQTKNYGDLTKWILPDPAGVRSSLFLYACSFTGDLTDWMIPTLNTNFEITANYFTGKAPNLKSGIKDGGFTYNVSKNYFTGINLTLLTTGANIIDIGGQFSIFPSSEVNKFLTAMADYCEANIASLYGNDSMDISGFLMGEPTDGNSNADIARIQAALITKGKTASFITNNPNSFTTGKLVFGWDGNYTSIITGAAYLRSIGGKSTIYVTSDTVGSAGCFSWVQLQTELASGTEIGCHSKTHTAFTSLSDAALAAELQAVDAAFATNSLPSPVNVAAYPFGAYNAANLLIIENYRLSGRDAYALSRSFNLKPLYKNANHYTLPAQRIDSIYNTDPTVATDINTILNMMDFCFANKSILIFYSHGYNDGSNISKAQMDAIINHANEIGMEMINHGELVSLFDV